MRLVGMRWWLIFVAAAVSQAGELHDAARACDVAEMRALLAEKPDLNALDESGRTPLHVAVDATQMHCVGLLMGAGADRTIRDSGGRTAADLSEGIADKRARATIRFYLRADAQQRPHASEAGPMPWTLEYAVLHGQSELVQMLLKMGADPNEVGGGGTTPLADAALKGDVVTARLLLEAGAHVDAVSAAGTQPIHDAALGGAAEVIRELAERGADVDARTRDEGRTALHLAAAMGKAEAAAALLDLGADRTVRDGKGRTALEAAERAGHEAVAGVIRGR